MQVNFRLHSLTRDLQNKQKQLQNMQKLQIWEVIMWLMYCFFKKNAYLWN